MACRARTNRRCVFIWNRNITHALPSFKINNIFVYVSKLSYIIIIFFTNVIYRAQNPVAFSITTEEGLPNQTIYSVIQDKKGFIWLGTDAGLYRYDGIRFKEYKNSKQLSRILTGFVIDTDGKIYGYNFKDQIFYIENDSLHFLSSWNKGRISNITVDLKNHLWVCYNEGIEKFSPRTNQWSHYNPTTDKKVGLQDYYTHSCYVDEQNIFWCLSAKGLLKIQSNNIYCYPLEWKKGKVSGEYQLAFNSKHKYIFSRLDGEVFHIVDDKLKAFYSDNLNPLLKDKKITRVEEDQSGNLWIYTFSGTIVYDIKNDKSRIYFNDKAFSCGIKDTENSYWFCSIYDGLLRVPELSNYIWGIKDEFSFQNKISRVISNNSSVYFATTSGKIGEFHNGYIKLYDLGSRLDIQTLALSKDSGELLFSAQNSIYKLNNGKISTLSNDLPPAKAILQIAENYIVATSLGTYWFNPIYKKPTQTLTNYWTRAIAYSKKNNRLWLATNNGIKSYQYINNKWEEHITLLNDIQIVSLSFSETDNTLYALTHDGLIYKSKSFKSTSLYSKIPEGFTCYQILVHFNELYAATNKGLWIYNLITKRQQIINRLSGLASDNVSALDIDNQNIWLASSKGIEQLPLHLHNKKTVSKLYLKSIVIDSTFVTQPQMLLLDYKQGFKVELEALAFSSENQFQYAYRINHNKWMYLPANVTEIDIPFLNSGNFKLEIKLVDHLGKDSQNTIEINGHVKPPFWQRWWFYILIGVLCLVIAFIIFKQRVSVIQKKQASDMRRLQLEHELKLSQETALRAQMNPHFIFNVLNSIKSYIYENDKKKAVGYLQRFSDLIRKILEQSSVAWVKLEDELEFLKLYIELESMLFVNDFEYNIYIDDTIDTNSTRIPSLILQPYIENSFKHGLRHKEGKKQLAIEIKSETESVLIITITDNGIGREQANKINHENIKKHTSFSTEAINRISVLNQNQPGIISILYYDLKHDNNNSKGTSVEIKINTHE